MKKVVIALGGNALGDTPSEQKNKVKDAALAVIEFIKLNYEVVICHGNGPQIGMINNSFSDAKQNNIIRELIPFPECGAMSQGYIGYHLQNAIQEALLQAKINKEVVTIITQTIVDSNDPKFKNPSKPIGPFLSKEDSEILVNKYGMTIMEDAGRGYRRVVASPMPITIREKNVINTLLNNGVIVIAGGGGGIPVIEKNDMLIGVDAVIDKDFTSAKIAELVRADKFIILTAVKNVAIDFKKSTQKDLYKVSVDELNEYILQNQFGKGSMLPKVQASISFVERTRQVAIIGDLSDASKLVLGKSGTQIYK